MLSSIWRPPRPLPPHITAPAQPHATDARVSGLCSEKVGEHASGARRKQWVVAGREVRKEGREKEGKKERKGIQGKKGRRGRKEKREGRMEGGKARIGNEGRMERK